MSERVTPACSLCGEAVGLASLVAQNIGRLLGVVLLLAGISVAVAVVSVRHRTRRLAWGWAASFYAVLAHRSIQPLAVGVSCAFQPRRACTSEIKELTSRLGRSHKATC
jgi:hypothetical protein